MGERETPSDTRPWFDHPILVLDVETTGFDPLHDRILEVALVHFMRGEVVGAYTSLVSDAAPLPTSGPAMEALAVNGITDELLATGKPLESVLLAVSRVIAAVTVATATVGAPAPLFAAYNAPFDRGFLSHALASISQPRRQRAGDDRVPTASLASALRASTPWLDPLVWARALEPREKHKLPLVAERLWIEMKGSHRALEDARVAGLVLYSLLRSRVQPDADAAEVFLAQRAFAAEQEVVFATRAADRAAAARIARVGRSADIPTPAVAEAPERLAVEPLATAPLAATAAPLFECCSCGERAPTSEMESGFGDEPICKRCHDHDLLGEELYGTPPAEHDSAARGDRMAAHARRGQ